MKTTKIAFKESAIVKVACLRPHMIDLLEHLLACAPDTNDGTMWVTEMWRPERHPNDAHSWCNAIDIRSRNVIADSRGELERIMANWGIEADIRLGRSSEYQFEAHGAGPSLHLHAEYDPR